MTEFLRDLRRPGRSTCCCACSSSSCPIMVVLEIFEGTRAFRAVVRAWARVVRHVGLDERSAAPTLVGFLFGLAYGGGVIVRDVRRHDLGRRQVFIMSVFLSMVHAIVEDSLIFIALGASVFWVVGVPHRLGGAGHAGAHGAGRRLAAAAAAPAPDAERLTRAARRAALTRAPSFRNLDWNYRESAARSWTQVNISMKSRYAVRALTELARVEQTQPGKPVRLGDIAERRDMPLQFLEQVFAALRRGGIVRSRRGAVGRLRAGPTRPTTSPSSTWWRRSTACRRRPSARRAAATRSTAAAPPRSGSRRSRRSRTCSTATTIGDLLRREDALREARADVPHLTVPSPEETHEEGRQHHRAHRAHAAGAAQPHLRRDRRRGARQARVVQPRRQRQGPHRPGDDRGGRARRAHRSRAARPSSSRPAATPASPWPWSPPRAATTGAHACPTR